MLGASSHACLLGRKTRLLPFPACPCVLLILLLLSWLSPCWLLQLLAEQNLSIASTSRRIDDVPARAELLQYERRFSELYDQVGGRR